MGTISTTAIGRVTLSYSAASTRKANTTAIPKAITPVFPAVVSWKAISVHSKP